MDKLVAGDWINCFGNVDHSVKYTSPRFTEMVFNADEPGLASAKCWLVKVPGMTATWVDIRPEKELLLCNHEGNESVQSAFILSGMADSRFSDRPVITQPNSHAFQYSPVVEERHVIKNRGLEAFHIEYDFDFFKTLLQHERSNAMDVIKNGLEMKQAVLIPPSQLSLQARMSEIIRTMQNCMYQSFTRALFIEAKLLELVAIQFEQINYINRYQKDAYNSLDKEKLHFVKSHIETNYLQPLSLKQLGRMAGLNEFKLKKGYKALFNTTVFGHIHHLRMEKAMQLLEKREMTVTEIAALLGYSGVGNFSSEFKKKFGRSPAKARA